MEKRRNNQNAADQEIIRKAAAETSGALTEIIEAAKTGDLRALHKLEAFNRYKDPQLAARVATMNRETRRAFEASKRGKKPSRGR